MALIVFGVATVASGIAMFRDGLEGTREFLWMMPAKPAAAKVEGAASGLAAEADKPAIAVVD